MRKFIVAFCICILISYNGFSQITSKREFRGVWISTAWQDQYKKMSVPQLKKYFIQMLDSLQACNFNAVIFQARPCADAFYYSEIEPWSHHFTGRQGKAPQTHFDPMEFLIEEAHKRHMEFHAWLNPYRVSMSESDMLHHSHIYYKHPEWFIKYGKQIYFDPGLPQSRKHICKVVKDIVRRYDVDAIHMDDYFYPYPISGLSFPDDSSFAIYGASQGFGKNQRDDWRRNNVNILIQQIKNTIVLEKPYVRFGISPFGIYRNKKSTLDGSGSNTNGLQNYDNLYADVKLWVEKGWIDYNIPQIYWEIGHSAADYETLIKWWTLNNYGAHLYIGQDVARTVKAKDLSNPGKNQLSRKMQLERSLPAVYGNCFWLTYEIMKNTGGIADSLRNNYHKYPALIPPYLHMHQKRPKDVKSLRAQWLPQGYALTWKPNGDKRNPENAQYYVVYCFKDKEKVNLDDPSKIVAVTRNTFYMLPFELGKIKYKYVVTSVDRFHNESKKGKSKTVRL
ncbi:MAG: family 10 glycosylhydrolase [Bacteroidales bacterium]|nr:family 10 glycosylhydrolase [Bacteroidales bacterium]